MMMTYKVFVSSTYIDNRERRRIVQDAITRAGMVWHGMEIFNASPHPPEDECIRFVKEADLLLGIIAWRYGWIPPGKEESITELEYKAATERLMFILDESIPLNLKEDIDQGDDRWEKQKKLEDFKKRIATDGTAAKFDDMSLGIAVLDSLNKWRQNHEDHDEKDVSDSSINISKKYLGEIDRAKYIIEAVKNTILKYKKNKKRTYIRLRGAFTSVSNIMHRYNKSIQGLSTEQAEELDQLLVAERNTIIELLNMSTVQLKCICWPKIKFLRDDLYNEQEKLERFDLLKDFLEDSKKKHLAHRQIICGKEGAWGNQLIIGNDIAIANNPESGGYTKTSIFKDQKMIDVLINEFDNIFKGNVEQKPGKGINKSHLTDEDKKRMIDDILEMLYTETEKIRLQKK